MIPRPLLRRYHSARLRLMRRSKPQPPEAVPLFVIGSGRSGNTLVRRVLLASEQIYVPPETYVLGEIIEAWPSSWHLPWRERIWLFAAFFERHPHFATFGLESMTPFVEAAVAAGPQPLTGVLDQFYRHLAERAGGAVGRWGDKTPWNTYHLPALGALYPQARYVWMVRDGRDVAASYAKAGLYDDVPGAATRWAVANRACARFARHAPHLTTLRYEAMVADPEAEFARIFAFAGLRFEPAMLERQPEKMGDVEALAHHEAVKGAISPKSVGGWKTKIDEATLKALPKPFWDEMGALGYS